MAAEKTYKDSRGDTRRVIPHVPMTRLEVAKLVGVHPDTLTRLLAEGLGSAVIQWGGHSKPMSFSRDLVIRWNDARTCTRFDGRPCPRCVDTLEDCRYTAEHLKEAKHGHDGCDECYAPWALGRRTIHGWR